MEWMEFLTIVVFVFAIVMLVAGIFTAYFGSGKSRRVGAALLIVGLLIGVLWAYLVGWSSIALFADVAAWDVMRSAVIYLVAAVVGALAAVGIFLVAVMKS
ncbi:MAG: hypothetical protein LBE48_03475 [Methanomassiliicoccaceae archaeon]|jgi:hypothetical protein|nr:hypothetical protein [Methanomassiliicoccaceae archaeon]